MCCTTLWEKIKIVLKAKREVEADFSLTLFCSHLRLDKSVYSPPRKYVILCVTFEELTMEFGNVQLK